MRVISASGLGFLHITISVLSYLVLANPYRAEYDDGTSFKSLAAVLKGEHGQLPFASFPHAQVEKFDRSHLPIPDPDSHVVKLRNNRVYKRHAFILQAPSASDARAKRFSVAVPVAVSQQDSGRHFFAFTTVEDLGHQKPEVSVHGFGVASGTPGLLDKLFKPSFDLNEAASPAESSSGSRGILLKKGDLISPDELAAAVRHAL